MKQLPCISPLWSTPPLLFKVQSDSSALSAHGTGFGCPAAMVRKNNNAVHSVGEIFNLAQRSRALHKKCLAMMQEAFAIDPESVLLDFVERLKHIMVSSKVRRRFVQGPCVAMASAAPPFEL